MVQPSTPVPGAKFLASWCIGWVSLALWQLLFSISVNVDETFVCVVWTCGVVFLMGSG